MQTVTVTRAFDAAPAAIERELTDLEPFMEAAGFTEVTVDGDRIDIRNAVGFLTIELTLDVVDREGSALTYVQRDGIFSEMETRYVVDERDGGCEVTATTEFEVDVQYLGPVFDATVVKRQRRHELNRQFDYLEEQVAG
ncbi:SRPBCC family protein [Halorarius litoreus]|uniref:SRPBCC family protein n=1 Tax=Halorarius litoreus TaxID=2962676 RepID=UPI0020CE5324|nr:SRPBCC family protein [Halorarius litoreus]